MKATQRLLYKSFLTVFILFAVYGCQSTDGAVSSEPSVSELTPIKTESGAKSVERVESQTSTVEKGTSATSVTTTDEAGSTDGKEAVQMKKFEKKFIGILGGHGGGASPGVSGEKEAAKSANTENRPYVNMEKKLYGKWINKLKTESYDFQDDGTVAVVVSGPRGKTYTLNGYYIFKEPGRIKIDFRKDPMASQMPPSYFKISISENEFSLTDEPKKKGGPDGPTTQYKREE